MEKMMQPYLWCSLATMEESEPWLMSGLKLSSSLPANYIPLPWSCSFIGGISFKECGWVESTGLGSSSVYVEFPVAIPHSLMASGWSSLECCGIALPAHSTIPSPETSALAFSVQLFLQEAFKSSLPLVQ